MLRDRARTIDEDAVETLAAEVRQFAYPLKTREDLDPLVERIGDAHFVLLGEASHGTSEYYQWRARLTSRLIAEKDSGLRLLRAIGPIVIVSIGM